MTHWRQNLPTDAILDLPYEDLVSEPEIWSRKMLDFIPGLPWDASCLEFHRTGPDGQHFQQVAGAAKNQPLLD